VWYQVHSYRHNKPFVLDVATFHTCITSLCARLVVMRRNAFYPCGVHPLALCTRISFKRPAIATENLFMLFFSLFTTF
jgi:hypothetical protein